ncbi:unnamed protein product [Lactuca virosa]|uniref:Uncharacterized protein n=1 Tax=Lactuca virosa TaxID=75947 RepID=A0AAU9MU51_9ASTR|nr:unnamed protein product [Lactuca virosa]
MKKLKNVLQICFHRSKFLHTRFHYTTLIPSTTHQELDPTKAYSNSVSSIPLFSLLSSCTTLSSLKELHSLLIVDGHSTQLNLQIKLVSLYGSFGDTKTARLVFDQMPNPDMFSCKVMIRWYFLNDLHLETIMFYRCMTKCLKEHDNVVFSIVVKACTKLRDINEGKKVHCHIVKAGNPDGFVLTSLVDMYAKCGHIKCSRRVFDDIIDKDVVSWTSMIVSYVQNGCPKEAFMVFNSMRSGLIQGNQHTFGSIVSACTKLRALHQGKWVHGYAIKSGIGLNSHVVSSLVDMYVKCGATLDARSVFNEHQEAMIGCPSVDLVTWTTMIVGYTQNGYPNEAITLFTDKNWIDILPNSVTISSVISACSQLGDSKLGKVIHSLGVKLGLEDGNVRNALVDMYAKCEMIKEARYLFDTISNKDLVSWNSIINGYAKIGCTYEVTRLFNQMRSKGFHPDEVTLVSLLSCFDLHLGSSLHAYSIKGFLSFDNVYIGTSLVNFYAKFGKLKTARHVFDKMPQRNTVSWNALINGHGIQGDCSASMELFNDMLKENLDPTDATFTSILSACSHTGMIEGLKFFDLITKEFEFVPKMKHYGSLVDLLARYGNLEEAFNFIKKMPVRPDVTLLGSFLHGCSMHSRFDLGEAMEDGIKF